MKLTWPNLTLVSPYQILVTTTLSSQSLGQTALEKAQGNKRVKASLAESRYKVRPVVRHGLPSLASWWWGGEHGVR